MVSSLKGIWLDNVLQYLSWPQSALVNSAEPPFSKKIVIAKGACRLFHLLECEYRWSTMSFLGLGWLIFEFPVLHRFVNPWEAGEVDVQTEKNNIWWLPLKKKKQREKNLQGSVWSWDLLRLRLFHAETNPKGIITARTPPLNRKTSLCSTKKLQWQIVSLHEIDDWIEKLHKHPRNRKNNNITASLTSSEFGTHACNLQKQNLKRMERIIIINIWKNSESVIVWGESSV